MFHDPGGDSSYRIDGLPIARASRRGTNRVPGLGPYLGRWVCTQGLAGGGRWILLTGVQAVGSGTPVPSQCGIHHPGTALEWGRPTVVCSTKPGG